MSLGLALFALVLFVSVFFLLEGAWLLWEHYRGPEVTRTRRRVGAISAGERLAAEQSLLEGGHARAESGLDRLLKSSLQGRGLERWLRQSGYQGAPGGFVVHSAMWAVGVLMLVVWAKLPIILTIAAVVAASLVPALRMRIARKRRIRRFEERFPDALDLLSRALRSGHSLPTALKFVGEKTADPIGSEFQLTFDEINYGTSLQQAMLNLAERVPSMDLRYFIVAVLIQRDTGGNLAELLDNLGYLVRERFKLVGRVRVLAAEGKLAAWILSSLPFAVAAVIFLVNPEYIAMLWTDPTGRMVSLSALAMMSVGIFWMSRIVRIRI